MLIKNILLKRSVVSKQVVTISDTSAGNPSRLTEENINMERETSVWTLFTKKDGDLFSATCNSCQREFSYKTSTSNLRKHWYRKHGQHADAKHFDVSDTDRYNTDNSEGEQEKTKRPKATWSYFEVVDSDKFEATCKICEKVVPFTSSSDLTQHIKEEHDEKHKDSDEEFVLNAEELSDDEDTSFRRRRFKSNLWKFFTPTCSKMAVCLLCKKLFNYRSTITNLRRHLVRKHKGARTPSREDSQKVFRVSEDGTLYEIETATGQEGKDYDNDEDPMATDTIYLNEEELNFSEPEPSIPNPKKKRKIESKYTKITKEQVPRSRNTCSEELELPRKQVSMHTPNTMSSLDYFGQYVVSLLKELPKPVSDQLQSVIIKQILTSKIALEPQNVPPKYEIKISQNNETEANSELVGYSLVQNNTTAEKVKELTESVVQD